MKKLLALSGIRTLNSNEQKAIHGGEPYPPCGEIGCGGYVPIRCRDYCDG